ncbi:MAG TPA: hypothetical protein PLD59_15715 [Tepidisphaeraceae bacterium]|nr:hypothetical protein [Tepidisphaeraceae bacterium]
MNASSSFLLPPVPGLAGTVTGARIVVAGAVGGAGTRYWTFQIINKGTGGSGTTQVLAATDANTTKSSTGINGGAGLTAYALAAFTLNGTTANRNVTAGQTLLLEITKTLMPDDLIDAVVEIDLEITGV